MKKTTPFERSHIILFEIHLVFKRTIKDKATPIKHFSINQMNETLKDNRSYFSLTTLYENLNTLVDKGYLKQIVVDKQSFYDTNTTNHIHVYHQEENKIYDYDDCIELHKDLPIPACLSLLEEYSLVINLKKKK